MTNDEQAGRPASSAARIEADIVATRGRLGESLEELGARLNPDKLKRDAMTTVRAGAVPVVATATAAGIGWLLWKRVRNGQRRRGWAATTMARLRAWRA